MSIPRVVESTSSDKLFSLVTGVLSVPGVSTDALLVFPGMGESWRIKEAVALWKSPNQTARFFMVAPVNSNERSYKLFRPVDWQIEDGKNILTGTDGENENTKTQAMWVAEMVRIHNIKSISLIVSSYHITRAYLTLLKALATNGITIPIIPRPVEISLAETIPETKVSGWQSIPGETKRIVEYQMSGDVATLEELQEYLDWLWKQPILSGTNQC